jgi:aryl sulfotransferase
VTGAVWLASYPRSGNTWTRLALRSLQGGGEKIGFADIGRFGKLSTRRELIDRALEVDSGMLTEAETQELRPDMHEVLYARADPPPLVKTHDAWLTTPAGRPIFDARFTHAAIYLIRDPRDVVLSWASFIDWPVDNTITFMANPKASLGHATDQIGIQVRQTMGSWSSHALSWIDESGLAPLVIRYEDMLADPAQALARMAAHLGWTVDAAAIAGAVETTRFDRLADQETRHGFTEKGTRTDRFFRSGVAGAWRTQLSGEQAARIERDHEAVMTRFGYL